MNCAQDTDRLPSSATADTADRFVLAGSPACEPQSRFLAVVAQRRIVSSAGGPHGGSEVLDEANHQVRVPGGRLGATWTAGSKFHIFRVTSPQRSAVQPTSDRPPLRTCECSPSIGTAEWLGRAGPVSQMSRGPAREGYLVSLSAKLHHGRVLWSG